MGKKTKISVRTNFEEEGRSLFVPQGIDNLACNRSISGQGSEPGYALEVVDGNITSTACP